jgi:hypothetical protein
MPRQSRSIQRLADERLDAVARASAASLDLQLDLVDERDGRLIGRYGGRWDRNERDYAAKDATRSRVIRLHPGQIEAAECFDAWIASHIAGDTPPMEKLYDLILSGGRRGGKSALAFTCAVAYALACPGSIVWVVAPSDAFYAEPMEYLESIMPREWYESLGYPHWTYFLPNGSTITLQSGHTPRRLKQGRCDFAVINEGQAVPTQSYTTLSASIVDNGGLVMTAANPPDVGDPGVWVADLVAGIESGEITHGEHFFFDPLLNPHIDQHALEALAEKMDPHTFDVQIRGKFLLPPDTVLHAWDRRENERPVPQLGKDITREFTRHFEGRAFDDIVGVDVQNYPWIVAVRARMYENPDAPGDLTRALMWGVGEVFIEEGDEVHCADALHEQGCHYERTLIICDASCDWQQKERVEAKQRTEYVGRGSMDMFRGSGFRHVVGPDPDMKKNPDIIDRVRAANARIGAKSGARSMFVDPHRCKMTVLSIRKWRRKPDGRPSRHSRAAHAGDAITYINWRFFPRRSDKTEIDVQSIRRFAGRDRLRGFSK